jgi:PAS domain S-box-containing protein
MTESNVGAGMTLLVSEKTTVRKSGTPFPELDDLLASAREFIGAAAGWIALHGSEGSLTVPVRGGDFSDMWLDWQQGRGSVWGFATDGGPALLNDLQSWSKVGNPPLHNLLSCPLISNYQILGHVSLANKAHGFALEDAAILRGLAHHAIRLLARRLDAAPAPIELSPAWQRILDRASEAVLLLDESGTLIYANGAWLDWTGFRPEELLGRSAPFPFWISQQDLVRALRETPAVPEHALPFRRRDQSVFWCLLETEAERWDDRTVTLAFLQKTAVPSDSTSEGQTCASGADRQEPRPFQPATPDWLPLLLDLDGGIEGWGALWEQRTGLSAHDVKGSRSDLVLDWLFPQQHDRDRVGDCFTHPGKACQLELAITTPTGSQRVLCTFIPWVGSTSTSLPRRWLLLVGDAEPLLEPGIIDATLRLDSSSAPHGPHPGGEATTPIVSPEDQ